ncbi:MAG: glycosyltransferase family 4 protein [Lutibacter sp.]|nr:glycosyltransferase family 4 protein [Lutibacter sp.]
MKILYIVQHFNIPDGSGGIRPYKMAKALVNSGIEVIVVCGSYSGAKTGLNIDFVNGKRRGFYENIEIIEFDMPYSNNLGFIKRTYLFLKFAMKTIWVSLFEKYDIIFASSTPLTVGIPGIFAKWIRRKTFVFEVRDLWPELPKAMGVIKNPIVLWGIGILEYMCYHSADKLIGLSKGIADGIEKRGIAKARIKTIPNGCDLDIFSTIIDSQRPIETEIGDFLCLYSGTHGVANGLDILIDVAEILTQKKRSDIKFILIGQGKYKKDLEEKTRCKNLKNIIFLDPVNKNELGKLMNACDIGMQLLANIPEFYNGTSPNKFFDYISAGLPVLNNYPGWISNLIEEKNCGVTIPPDDPGAFADGLLKISNNRNKLNLMSINAKQLARKSFDRVILGKEWVDWVISK